MAYQQNNFVSTIFKPVTSYGSVKTREEQITREFRLRIKLKMDILWDNWDERSET